MALRFFNTYSRELEEFRPLIATAGRECTPAGRRFTATRTSGIFAPTFSKICSSVISKLRGYKVHRVMNITDVDDKTIRGAREAGVPLAKFTAPFKQAFFEDLDTLQHQARRRFSGRDGTSASSGDDRDDREVDRARPGVSGGRQIGLFSDQEFPELRTPRAFRSRGTAIDRPREERRIRQGTRRRFRALESVGRRRRRCRVGKSVGTRAGPAGTSSAARWRRNLLGDQIDIHCGGVDNIFPASRSGDCANRGLHRKTICALLAALRASPGRRPENVEVVRQFLHPARRDRERDTADAKFAMR